LSLCLLLLGMLAFPSGSAPAEPWSKSFDTDISLTQNSYSNSWTGGEAGTVSWVWNVNGTFEKQIWSVLKFKNTSKLSFGQTHLQDKTTKEWARPVKSTDLIDIENLGLFTVGSLVEPFAALRLESQFLDGSTPGKKLYLSPAKLTESAGGARILYKTEKNELLCRLGLAMRQIVTREFVDPALDETRATTTNDGGLESVTDLKLVLSETLSFTSKLSLYRAFFSSESGGGNDESWKTVDVNWENRISATVVKYVTVNLYSQLLYDKESDPRGRFKQTLALGFVYKLF